MSNQSFEQTVMVFIKKHQLLKEEATIVVGVSGGADSIALLHYLCTLRDKWKLHIAAVSVDHGLRGRQSAEDVKFVEQLCALWQVTFVKEKVDVKKEKNKLQEGTQLVARKLRYRVFEKVMEQFDADYLALAHHGDDQLETVLMRLTQHSNPSLLAGIPVKRKFSTGEIIRPFLCTTKEAIYHYCDQHQLMPREDPSNQSVDYTRNFYRLNVLPFLKEKNQNIHRQVQQLTERIREDDKYLTQKAEEMVSEIVQFPSAGKTASFSIPSFLQYPIALQRRAFHLILNYLYNHQIPDKISMKHEEDFLTLLQQSRANVTIDLPKSLHITKSYQEISFHFQIKQPKKSVAQKLHIPGVQALWNGFVIESSISTFTKQESHHSMYLPNDESLFPLIVRTRQAGDRMKIRGLNGSKKVKDIFIDKKIPIEKRDSWPLLVGNNGTILWIIGLTKAEILLEKMDTFISLHYKSAAKKAESTEQNISRRHHDAR
ncbi:tRNA lysidine(34) synthetase TilS [Gracilibacillus dipsosauri]|uniref:tRNA(Ile)-lysidine synthase n=1 Tax=Gracilibacillus dipsosauri TaxID=178340 RepID=A0A317KWK1_9BACI|nr:tRNA lysidine(34) synthetase TilS [Gracilibacillus dipsosauri]PWU67815.1 tRNA lysidine(34) synthetase TilS [Gracilibacillus dipsosauri]